MKENDTISRQAAIDAITKYCLKYDLRELLADIECLPTADLSEYSDKLWKAAYERGKAEAHPKKGKWIATGYDGYADGNPVYYEWECSACGCVFEDEEPTYKFCPNCGARMEE